MSIKGFNDVRITMTVPQALTIMQLQGQFVTRDLIKNSYRKLASKFHPDKNPNGLRQMQDVNVAYEYLSQLSEERIREYAYEEEDMFKEPPEFDIFRRRGMHVNQDGYDDKIWVEGNTYPHRELLKQYKFRWCPDEKAWWRNI